MAWLLASLTQNILGMFLNVAYSNPIIIASQSCSTWLIQLGEVRKTLSRALKQSSDLMAERERTSSETIGTSGPLSIDSCSPRRIFHLITWLIQHSRWPLASVQLCERFVSFRADKIITWIELCDDESRASTRNKAIRADVNFLFLNNYFLFWDFKRRLLLESVSQALFVHLCIIYIQALQFLHCKIF